MRLAGHSNEYPKISKVKFYEAPTFLESDALHSKEASWNIDERLSPQMPSENGIELMELDMYYHP